MGTNGENDKDSKLLENHSRRKAVKKIVGGVSALAAYNMLPVKWETPIIEQIFLPAHAQTSGSGSCCGLTDPCEIILISGYQDSNTVLIQVNGYVTPPTGGLPVTIVATGNPDATATSTINTTTDADGNFSEQITLQTATGLGSVAVTTTVEGVDDSATCSINIPQREPKPEDPCITVTFVHAPTRFRRNGVRLQGTDCAGGDIDVRIYHRAGLGPTSVSLSFNRINPEILSRVGNNDVIAERVYLDGTTDTVDCRNQTILTLTNVVTVTFTAAP